MRGIAVCLVVLAAFALSTSGLQPVHEAVVKAQAKSTDAPKAEAIISLNSLLFDALISGMRDYIELLVLNYVQIPGMSAPHYTFGNFNFSTIDTASINVSFATPSRALLNLNQLLLVVPATAFTVTDTVVVKQTCTGTFSGTLTNSNVSVAFDFRTASNGTAQIAGVEPIVEFGTLNLQLHLDGNSCTISQKILEELMGGVNAAVEAAVEQTTPMLLASLVKPQIDKLLKAVPAGVFTGQPFVEGQLFSVGINLLSFFHNVTNPSIAPPPVGTLPPLPDRDFALSISAESVDELLAIEAAAGKIDFAKTIPTVNTSTIALLLPGASALCPECPLNIGVDVSHGAALRTDFTNDTFAIKTIDVALHLNAVAKNGTIVELAILAVNATADLNDLSIKNDTIYFTLAVPELDLGVVQSNAGPLNGPELSALLSLLLNNLVIPKFNKDFKGIVLPIQKNGMGLVRTRAVVSHNYFILAADIKL